MAAPAPAHGAADDVARIGPNSIIRMAEALTAAVGQADTADLFAEAGLSHHLAVPPDSMVPAADVTALHRVLRARLDRATMVAVSRRAGEATGDYLLAHRIPKPAQVVLKLLPPVPAARILIKAMGKHAWTFAGAGRFEGHAGRPTRLVIAGGPIQAAVPGAGIAVCDYYAATFERLFRELVARKATVREVACEAAGGTACTFEVVW
ncbi:bacteriochlorophyll 4-vinyl reductase [Roseospira navarrensis]|uniref:Bacteriochlorophyll 4-vinyl reductase n=2 Tax=Roseospira navarrensis TaxID=140058 RepID=A0A7X1ZAH4_9PROT|nr:bacteriochlorophyll 4-vinyl reductase [Roseospira navarrensis]